MAMMKHILGYVFFLGLCLTSSCKKEDNPAPVTTGFTVKVYPPASISKTNNANVYVHVMPWFESPSTSSNGKWGQHWTMANQDPTVIDLDGKRQIASHFYPQTGPYASSDPDIIEYQLLLMKLSGIDGVLIDWYGSLNLNDYPANLANTESIISALNRVGLHYAIVYEDAVIKNVSGDVAQVAAAKADMLYAQNNYFNSSNYIKVDSKPLLLTFGPQTFKTESSWTSIFSDLSVKPKFLTLWYQSGQAGSNAGGEFSWIYQDAKPHLTHLDDFYAKSSPTFKMGSAYPGFKDFYTEGGWGDNVSFSIDYFDPQVGSDIPTFTATLTKALENTNYIQIATWNDYGEGTMIEPTTQFHYDFLTTIQKSLGVSIGEHELDLVFRLYKARKSVFTALNKKKMDQVFYDLVSLKFIEAEALLVEIGG